MGDFSLIKLCSLLALAPNGKEKTPLPAGPTDGHRIASGLRKVERRAPGGKPCSIACPIQHERTDRLVRRRVSFLDIPPGFASGPEVRDPNDDDVGKVRHNGPENLC